MLAVIDSKPLPEPPYPADTRVRGWRFELDTERMRRSDTWVMADPEWRPWLLMVWITAWDQQPAGSLPADHQIIARHVGMDARLFSAHADILLRGFRRHSDGRLYHPVVVDQVRAMLEVRKAGAERAQRWRDKLAGVTRYERERTGDSPVRTLPEPEPEPVSNTQPTAESAVDLSPAPARTPFSAIAGLWREILPELPQPHDPSRWTEARKTQIRARWRDELPDLESWRGLFEDVRRSPFLMGKVPPRPGRKPFLADLFWVTKPENLLRISEGRYDG